MLNFIKSIIFLICLAEGNSFAAKVTKVDTTKKVITIDEGTETSFVKNAKICFYNEKSVKIGCAFIKSSKAKIAFIKIKSDKLLAKIAVGLNVKIEAPPAAATTTAGISAEPVAPVTGTKAPPKSYIIALLGLPILSPVKYQNLLYETPSSTSVSSMWSTDSAVNTLAVGLEYGLGIGSFQLALGARTRFFIAKKISADYADADSNRVFEQYMDTSSTASAVGAWADFYWLHLGSGVVSFRLGNGIDFDSSKVNFLAVQKSDDDDSSVTRYGALSTLTAISLRFLPSLDFAFGPIHLSLGATIFVPLSQSSQLKLGTFDDPLADKSLNTDLTAEQDLKKALKHQAKAGADLILSAGFNF